MRRPRKRGKHVEDPISGNCLDRISSLPDKLLGHVLSFLPTRLAVITSILSTRWRYLFTLTTCLSFDDQISYVDQEPNEIIEATRCFNEFVDKVVKLHQISPIKKFSLVCHGTYDKSDLNRWLTNALQKGVQELSYERYGSIDRVSDHDSLFMCETLVSLKMKDPGYNTIKFPQSARLPKLKILHLDWILFFDFNSMEKLFSGCQLLEELTLKCCGCHTDGHAFHRTEILKVLTVKSCNFTWGTFEIDAPNLVYLRYSSSTGVRIFPSWKSSCSFDKAKLHLDYNYDKDSVKYDRELLKAAAYKVTKLRFMNNSVQVYLCTPYLICNMYIYFKAYKATKLRFGMLTDNPYKDCIKNYMHY
ncbi:hypothetical protein RND81_04G098700 [Saponaria officinalis]|uniref:F-box domain-containing protein n=1 Tax=Saponaria officinalis TaxID=3572 RepID=A0AAW1LGA4_SAPOF